MKQAQLILKKQKMRATPQRLAIFQLLSEKRRHLTAEEIFKKIKSLFPAFSLATVYATLEHLKNKGLVSEIRIQPQRRSFELKRADHHHLLCRHCGKIWDILMVPCAALKRKEVAGHLIEELHGYFYGLCVKCRGKKI